MRFLFDLYYIIDMDLNVNIEKLNQKYKAYNLRFRPHEDIIIIDEDFVIANDPKLKQELKDLYSIIFDWEQKFWYIGEIGIKRLTSTQLKVEPSQDLDELKKELIATVEIVKDTELKNLIYDFLKNFPEFFDVPCAITYHHNYIGGLLEHTVQTCRIALSIATKLKKEIEIDIDLLVAGAILHDIGKIDCYKYQDGKIEATTILNEQDHIINGIKILSQNFSHEKLDEIIHIIASHHNLKEWGSPIQPSSNEAWIIHFSENLSSKILG